MKVYCSHPGCQNYRQLPWYNALILRWSKLWLCPEHRDTWEGLDPWS